MRNGKLFVYTGHSWHTCPPKCIKAASSESGLCSQISLVYSGLSVPNLCAPWQLSKMPVSLSLVIRTMYLWTEKKRNQAYHSRFLILFFLSGNTVSPLPQICSWVSHVWGNLRGWQTWSGVMSFALGKLPTWPWHCPCQVSLQFTFYSEKHHHLPQQKEN